MALLSKDMSEGRNMGGQEGLLLLQFCDGLSLEFIVNYVTKRK